MKTSENDRQDVGFQPGDLVEILTDRTHTSDGLTATFTAGKEGVMLYARIDVDTYPSHEDFHGAPVDCQPGQLGNIVRYIGRPMRIRRGAELWEYDIYELLTAGHSVQVFANNLKLLHRTHGPRDVAK